MALTDLLGSALRGTALGLAMYVSSCGGPSPSMGCQRDTDCYAPRVCVEGECQDSYEDTNNDNDDSNSRGKDNNCNPRASKGCYLGEVYWEDSCGQRGEQEKKCSESCRDGECVTDCNVFLTEYEGVCYDNDPYWQDNCGNLGKRIENCGEYESCWRGLACDYESERWEDLGNGTIRDLMLGVLWQKDSFRRYDCIQFEGDENCCINYDTAPLYCNSLSLGGRENWRVPSIEELESLVLERVEESCHISSIFEGLCRPYTSSDLGDCGCSPIYGCDEMTVDFEYGNTACAALEDCSDLRCVTDR